MPRPSDPEDALPHTRGPCVGLLMQGDLKKMCASPSWGLMDQQANPASRSTTTPCPKLGLMMGLTILEASRSVTPRVDADPLPELCQGREFVLLRSGAPFLHVPRVVGAPSGQNNKLRDYPGQFCLAQTASFGRYEVV